MAAQQKDPEIIELAKTLRGTPWCDEYEQMISGMLYVYIIQTASRRKAKRPALTAFSYDPLNPKLMEGRHKARGAAYNFNNLDPNTGNFEEIGKKQFELLQKILGRIGEGTFIEPPFQPDYGCNITIGKNCFMNFG